VNRMMKRATAMVSGVTLIAGAGIAATEFPASADAGVEPADAGVEPAAVGVDRVCSASGCSYARIESLYEMGLWVFYGDAVAVDYSPTDNVWVDYIFYGPNWTVLDSGRRNCNRSRPCSLYTAAIGVVGPGGYAMCVHTWIAGSSTQPQACATLSMK